MLKTLQNDDKPMKKFKLNNDFDDWNNTNILKLMNWVLSNENKIELTDDEINTHFFINRYGLYYYSKGLSSLTTRLSWEEEYKIDLPRCFEFFSDIIEKESP